MHCYRVAVIAAPSARRPSHAHNYDVNNLATVPNAIVANLGRAAESESMSPEEHSAARCIARLQASWMPVLVETYRRRAPFSWPRPSVIRVLPPRARASSKSESRAKRTRDQAHLTGEATAASSIGALQIRARFARNFRIERAVPRPRLSFARKLA